MLSTHLIICYESDNEIIIIYCKVLCIAKERAATVECVGLWFCHIYHLSCNERPDDYGFVLENKSNPVPVTRLIRLYTDIVSGCGTW